MPKWKGLQCYAVSAKRYVLFTRDQQNRSSNRKGIGEWHWIDHWAIRERNDSQTGPAHLGPRSDSETLPIRYRGLRKQRMGKLLAFDVPMRRKLPISQPSIWSSRGFRAFNRGKVFDHQIKPFSFLQTITPD